MRTTVIKVEEGVNSPGGYVGARILTRICL